MVWARAAWRATLALAALPGLLAAQDAMPLLRGRIESRQDGRSVAAAEVRHLQNRAAVRTDAEGRFRLRGAIGDSLEIRAIGFLPLRAVAGDAPVYRLEPAALALPDLITTAGQRTMRVSDMSGSVTIVDSATISAAAAVSVNQVLRQLPGIQEVPSPPSRTTLSIRGLSDSRVLLLIDGEPVAGAALDLRDIGRLSTLAVERIEVTKGPSGVEFGSDALGGVVNLVTAPPTERLQLEAVGRAGGLGRRESTLGASMTRGALGVRVSGGVRQLNVLTGVNADATTQNQVVDLRSDVRFKVSDRVSLRADLQSAVERQRWPVGGDVNGFIDNTTAQALLEGEARAAGGITRLRVFGQQYRYQFRQARGLLPIAGTGDSLAQRETLARVLLAHTRVTGAHTIDAGVQFTQREIGAPGRISADSASDRLIEVFARDAMALGPVLLNAGARVTTSELWGSVVAPSVGAVWYLAPTWRVQGNLARGFRAPGFKEIRYTFTNAAAGYLIAGNADLRPESSWSTSAALNWQVTPRLTIGLEGYRNAVRNLIDTRFSGIDPSGLQLFRNVNVAAARTEGIETGVQWQLGRTDLSAGWDILRARDLDSGLPLNRRATHTARVHAARRFDLLEGLQADATFRVTGAAPLISSDITSGVGSIAGQQDAFASLDLQVRLGLQRGAELSLGVNNAFGRVPTGWTPAFARQFFVGLSLRQGGDRASVSGR